MANLKTFVKETFVNNGASYNLITGVFNPTSGYMVALQGREKICSKSLESTFQYDVAEYIKEHWSILLGGVVSDTYCLGSWIHEDKIYLDISANVSDLKEAIFLGKKYKQLAIWDCVNKVEIIL